MKILAIFTCFNRKELTKRGMATLSENRDVTFDYVILDDNSSDGTREMLKQMRDDGTYQIDLIEGDGSNFWNGGMHKAIEHIKNTHMDYDYYMLMNDDTKFFPGIFDEMAPHLKKDDSRCDLWRKRRFELRRYQIHQRDQIQKIRTGCAGGKL